MWGEAERRRSRDDLLRNGNGLRSMAVVVYGAKPAGTASLPRTATACEVATMMVPLWVAVLLCIGSGTIGAMLMACLAASKQADMREQLNVWRGAAGDFKEALAIYRMTEAEVMAQTRNDVAEKEADES